MYCPGMGQHRKQKGHNYTDLVCMALPREACNVIEDKQRTTLIDLTKGNNFCELKVVYQLHVHVEWYALHGTVKWARINITFKVILCAIVQS